MNTSRMYQGQILYYRCGRHTNGTSPSWGEWVKGNIVYLSRKRNGDIASIVFDGCDAEFSQLDYSNNTFNCEDYLVEIKTYKSIHPVLKGIQDTLANRLSVRLGYCESMHKDEMIKGAQIAINIVAEELNKLGILKDE